MRSAAHTHPASRVARHALPRFGIVEGLLGDELPVEQAARAFEAGQREFQIGVALTDRGLRVIANQVPRAIGGG